MNRFFFIALSTFFYNISIYLLIFSARIGSFFHPKTKKWVKGRKAIFRRLKNDILLSDKVIWFHAASHGEFEEGRPLIEQVKLQYPQYKILLTFFSPSGYEPCKNYPVADWVYYLPADTKRNVRQFLEIAHPEVAIFIKYEFWINLLKGLKDRDIRSFVISARFISDSRFFKSWGVIFRNALKTFETIFVQDEQSVRLLESIGVKQVVVAGDPRFDRVKTIAASDWSDSIIENFKNGRKIFIAGSTCKPSDDELIQQLINRHRGTKFVVVPHEIDNELMLKYESKTIGKAIRYTQCNSSTQFDDYQVLIVDTIGQLSRIYRYGNWAFIGGGFVAGIHSVIEATIYGMPAAFGPNFNKNRPGIEMVKSGICSSINNIDELDKWFSQIETDDQRLHALSMRALDYTLKNTGATDLIIRTIWKKQLQQ